MNSEFKAYLSTLLKQPIQNMHPVSGGDISQAYKINTPKYSYFIKVNTSHEALNMFQAEALALETIQNTQTIKTPEVLFCDTFQITSFLILEFIETKSPSHLDLKTLGIQLAKLHQNTAERFGFEHNNFIGSLPQRNQPNASWVDFYIKERLLPQLQLAIQRHLLSDDECSSEKRMHECLYELCHDVKPSLLHGDLWSGNYIISKNGTPYLIDPAAYYGHNEVDIAMTRLFGGFDNEFYNAYFSVFPQDSKTNSRIEIYQLYYLLVHLNLFGRSYYNSVKTILNKYF